MAQITSPAQDLGVESPKIGGDNGTMDTRISVSSRTNWYQRSPDAPTSARVRERMHAIASADFMRYGGRRTITVTAMRANHEVVTVVVRSGEHCATCACSTRET